MIFFFCAKCTVKSGKVCLGNKTAILKSPLCLGLATIPHVPQHVQTRALKSLGEDKGFTLLFPVMMNLQWKQGGGCKRYLNPVTV